MKRVFKALLKEKKYPTHHTMNHEMWKKTLTFTLVIQINLANGAEFSETTVNEMI